MTPVKGIVANENHPNLSVPPRCSHKAPGNWNFLQSLNQQRFCQRFATVKKTSYVPSYCPKAPWDVMGVKTTCFKAPGVSLGGSGVSIGGVRSLRVIVL